MFSSVLLLIPAPHSNHACKGAGGRRHAHAALRDRGHYPRRKDGPPNRWPAHAPERLSVSGVARPASAQPVLGPARGPMPRVPELDLTIHLNDVGWGKRG